MGGAARETPGKTSGWGAGGSRARGFPRSGNRRGAAPKSIPPGGTRGEKVSSLIETAGRPPGGLRGMSPAIF